MAELVASDMYDWVWAAEAWNLLHDRTRARKCLLRSELQHSSFEGMETEILIECAASWQKMFHEGASAKWCLRAAERKVDSCADCLKCADAWIKKIKSRTADAVRCLRRAETTARDYSDWADCADAWQKLLGDHTRSRNCRTTAKKHAKSARDMIAFASESNNKSTDQEDVEEWLDAAERKAKSPYELAECAHAWLKSGDRYRAFKCAAKAEQTSMKISHWWACAFFWWNSLKNKRRAEGVFLEWSTFVRARGIG